MKAGTLWTTAMAAAGAAACISVAAAILSNGLAQYVFLLTAAVFAATAAVIIVSRRRYLELLDKESEIDCLRLKRPGVEQPAEELPVPKGKMPKQ